MKINYLRNIFIITYLIFNVAAVCSAEEWVSPIDKKYSAKYPHLSEYYTRAKNIMDNYRGNGNELLEAKSLLEKVINEDKDFAPAYKEYSRVVERAGYINGRQYQEGILDLAISIADKSIELEPNYAEAYVFLAFLYTQKKSYTNAEESLKKAESIGTKSPWFNFNWGRLLWYQDKLDDAVSRYKKVVDSNTENKLAYSQSIKGIADVYLEQEKIEDALSWYKRSVDYEPENAWTWGNYGAVLLYRAGDYDEAIKVYKKALEKMEYGLAKTQYADALYAKWASIMMESGDEAEAELYRLKAIEINPDSESAVNNLRKHEATVDVARYIEQRRLDVAMEKYKQKGYKINPDHFKVKW